MFRIDDVHAARQQRVTAGSRALPELSAKRDELEAKGAKLVLIAVLADGESSGDARRALASWGVSASFLIDSQGTGRREAGVTALPTTMVIDKGGVVKWVAPAGAMAADVNRVTD